jgi:hypothetical protein
MRGCFSVGFTYGYSNSSLRDGSGIRAAGRPHGDVFSPLEFGHAPERRRAHPAGAAEFYRRVPGNDPVAPRCSVLQTRRILFFLQEFHAAKPAKPFLTWMHRMNKITELKNPAYPVYPCQNCFCSFPGTLVAAMGRGVRGKSSPGQDAVPASQSSVGSARSKKWKNLEVAPLA